VVCGTAAVGDAPAARVDTVTRERAVSFLAVSFLTASGVGAFWVRAGRRGRVAIGMCLVILAEGASEINITTGSR
jgi:hypothetical protein